MSINKTKTYAELKAELEELMAWFDQENIDVDQAIAKYEEAITLTKQLEAYLTTAENKIKKLAS